MLRGKRVVVTGGAGFIGSHLVERLAGANEVVVLDNLSVGRLQNLAGVAGPVKVVKASILDPKALHRTFRDADVVFHLAALTSVPESIERPLPYAETNMMGTLNVLDAAREAGAKRVVFASTCAIYGRGTGPLKETARLNPLSPYAATKLASEYFCRSAAAGGGLEAIALRLFNVYGPRQSVDSPYAGVIAKFVHAVAAGRPLTLHGDGKQTRDFVYVEDVAGAFERAAMARDATGVFNIGSGRETSIVDVIEALEAIAGRKLRVKRESPRAGDIRRSRADVRRAREGLHFEAKTRLEDGLRRALAAVRPTSS